MSDSDSDDWAKPVFVALSSGSPARGVRRSHAEAAEELLRRHREERARQDRRRELAAAAARDTADLERVRAEERQKRRQLVERLEKEVREREASESTLDGDARSLVDAAGPTAFAADPPGGLDPEVERALVAAAAEGVVEPMAVCARASKRVCGGGGGGARPAPRSPAGRQVLTPRALEDALWRWTGFRLPAGGGGGGEGGTAPEDHRRPLFPAAAAAAPPALAPVVAARLSTVLRAAAAASFARHDDPAAEALALLQVLARLAADPAVASSYASVEAVAACAALWPLAAPAGAWPVARALASPRVAPTTADLLRVLRRLPVAGRAREAVRAAAWLELRRLVGGPAEGDEPPPPPPRRYLGLVLGTTEAWFRRTLEAMQGPARAELDWGGVYLALRLADLAAWSGREELAAERDEDVRRLYDRFAAAWQTVFKRCTRLAVSQPVVAEVRDLLDGVLEKVKYWVPQRLALQNRGVGAPGAAF